MTDTPLAPYLLFGGRCEEAIAFYKDALRAEIVFKMLYNDSPQPMPPGSVPAGFENKVMHATLRVGGSVLMVSDGNTLGANFAGFTLSLSYETPEEADMVFEALAAGGQVKMPMAKTFWSPRFGMLADRFGVSWMVSVPGEAPKPA